MKHTVIALFAVLTASVFAVEPAATYDFEGTTGLPESALKGKGKIEFVEGVKGKAIKMADNTLNLPCPEGVTGEAGSVAMWIKPVNWNHSSKEFVSFLFNQNKSVTGRMHIYKYREPDGLGITFWYGSTKNDKLKTVTAYRKADYQQGEWFFFVMTWDKKSNLTSLYYNGKRVTGSRPGQDVFFKEFGDFILNAVPFNPGNRANATVYDLVRFYKEPLSASDVAKMYKAEKPSK